MIIMCSRRFFEAGRYKGGLVYWRFGTDCVATVDMEMCNGLSKCQTLNDTNTNIKINRQDTMGLKQRQNKYNLATRMFINLPYMQ